MQVNSYPECMLIDSRMSDQLEPEQKKEDDVKEGEDKKKEVEHRVQPPVRHLKAHEYHWPR